jgi:hypothetical protein
MLVSSSYFYDCVWFGDLAEPCSVWDATGNYFHYALIVKLGQGMYLPITLWGVDVSKWCQLQSNLSLEVCIWHVVVKGQVALCWDLGLQYLEGNGRCGSPRDKWN